MKRKLGLRPHDPAAVKLRLKDYFTSHLPTVDSLPQTFGHADLIKPHLYLNSVIGDCAIAGSIEEVRLLNACRGVHVPFTDYTAVQNYSAIAGYVPGPEISIDNDRVVGYDPQAPPNPTDQGTDVAALYTYRQATGIIDADGNRHKVQAWAALTPGDFDELLVALYLFETVGIGIQVPDYAEAQFEAGGPWQPEAGRHKIVGGHYIPACEARSRDEVGVFTWGAMIGLTSAFYQAFCTVAVVSFTQEMLTGGTSLEGVDQDRLARDIAALGTGPVTARKPRSRKQPTAEHDQGS